MRVSLWTGGLTALVAGLSWIAVVMAAAEPNAAEAGAPDKKVPDVETHVVEGRIGCSLGGPLALSTTDQCGKHGLTPGTSGQVFVEAGKTGPLTAAYYRLTWTPSHPELGGEYLGLRYPFMTAREVSFETSGTPTAGNVVRGTSPLTIKAQAVHVADPLARFDSDWKELPFDVRSAAGGSDDPQSFPWLESAGRLVLDQPFNLCVVLAFDGAELPDEPVCP